MTTISKGVLVAAALAVLCSGCTSAATHDTQSGPLTAAAPAPTGTGAASSSVTPLSDLEGYPAVQAMRQWTSAAGRAVNSGSLTGTALDALMTSRAKTRVRQVLGRYLGDYFPGPLPFQPTGIAALDVTHETIYGCAEVDGWAQGRTDRKPVHARKVTGAQFAMVRENGPWQVDVFSLNSKISCSDVKVKAPTW